MNTNEEIGAKMKALRMEKGYTLKQISEDSGLSIGFLSQFERGISSITLDALETLLNLLGVPISALFEDRQNRQQTRDLVVRGAALQFSPISAQLYHAPLAKPGTGKLLLPQIYTLLPLTQPDDPPEPQTYAGEKFLYVLEGILTLYYENQQLTLYPGDSLVIAANRQHSWRNRTTTAIKFLAVCAPIHEQD